MQITLKPVKASIKIFKHLEKKGLISVLKPTDKAIKTRTKTGTVDILYTSNKRFGSHRLMCIGKRTKKVQLCYHFDNEDFIFINPSNTDYQKLYLVFALDKIDIFNKKLSENLLSNKDFVAVEIVYNDPNLSFFTMLKKTVHCEVVKDEDKQHPVFFVTESSDLKNNKIKHKDLTISVGD
ncbi:MAG: hypothetical protein K5622_01580 [Endomicrobiaceae bacterium]|nr:hypothetical protein [Endomicrobiaceae bacterium]